MPNDATSDQDYISRKEASVFLESLGVPLAPQTLAWLAAKGENRGPPFYKIRGYRVGYKRGELRDWALEQIVKVQPSAESR